MLRLWRTPVVDARMNHRGHRGHRGLRSKDLGVGREDRSEVRGDVAVCAHGCGVSTRRGENAKVGIRAWVFGWLTRDCGEVAGDRWMGRHVGGVISGGWNESSIRHGHRLVWIDSVKRGAAVQPRSLAFGAPLGTVQEVWMSNGEQGGSVAWWDHTWAAEGAVWARALEGLTAEQAAWSPPNAPGVADTAGGAAVGVADRRAHDLLAGEHGAAGGGSERSDARGVLGPELPGDPGPLGGAWADTRRRFDDSHRAVGAAVRAWPERAGQAMELLPHDAYHIGQVCYLRAMLGLAPLQ
jgi:hypothetical protein